MHMYYITQEYIKTLGYTFVRQHFLTYMYEVTKLRNLRIGSREGETTASILGEILHLYMSQGKVNYPRIY